MNKDEYLKKQYVIEFIKWITHKHDSLLFNSYKSYIWNGKKFNECQKELESIKIKLKKALEDEDEKETKDECIKILVWGGVKYSNENYIKNNPDIISELKFIKTRIDPCNFDINNQSIIEIKTNSGFSKIYSILLGNFIIYDSRVAAAICYFIRLFCEEKEIEIPEELLFEIPKGREMKNRNPSNKKYKFKEFDSNNYKHLKYNIKASWLLYGILEKTTKFNEENNSLRALEAAFFMIGYDTLSLGNNG